MKQIVGYPKYKIDEYGNIYSFKRKNPIKLKFTISGFGGYYRVGLHDENRNNKHFFVHRLVALTYLPKIEGKNIVNHIDGNRLNNHISNLEWCTQSENIKNAVRRGTIVSYFSKGFKINYFKRKVKCFFSDGSSKRYQSITDAANDNKILISSIHNNIKGKTKVCGNNLKFKYDD